MEDFKSLCAQINRYLDENPLNIVQELGGIKIYDQPVVAIAAASDPLYLKLKEPGVVGEHHMSPLEWLPEGNSVISYFLPFSNEVRHSNSILKDLPSEEWLVARIQGEQVNNGLRQFIVDSFRDLGEKAVAPVLDSRFKVVNRISSNWSERHTAFIAGLGTFNLSKSFITEKGCSGRFGSVIVSKTLTPTPRKYTDIYELCNQCGACIPQCPVDAITAEGKDHGICQRFIDDVIKPRYAPRYGCGKCQTAVPCESGIPF